jgi:O-antigen/teichoic acid export membrane protein
MPRFIRPRLTDPLARTSVGLAASTAVSAVVGIGFWAVAARIYSAQDVGRDSVLIAALLALSAIGQLNLSNAFPRFLPQVRTGRGRYVSAGYFAAFTFSLILGVAFVVIAPSVAASFGFVHHSPIVYVLFPIAVAAWTIFSLQDAVIVALGRARWLPIENGLFSAARIVVLPVLLLLGCHRGVLLAFVIPMLIAVPVMNWFIVRFALPRAEQPDESVSGHDIQWRELSSFLMKDFVGAALAQVAMAAMPVLVVVLLGARMNAYFYVPFTLILAFDQLFMSVAWSLTTEGARDPERARQSARRAIGWLLRLQLPASLAIVALAPLILRIFGPEYVEHGTLVLRLLAGASSLRAVVSLYGAVARLQGHGGRILALSAGSATSLIGAVALLGSSYGLTGVAIGWLATWGLIAVLCAAPLRAFSHRGVVWGSRQNPSTRPTHLAGIEPSGLADA